MNPNKMNKGSGTPAKNNTDPAKLNQQTGAKYPFIQKDLFITEKQGEWIASEREIKKGIIPFIQYIDPDTGHVLQESELGFLNLDTLIEISKKGLEGFYEAILNLQPSKNPYGPDMDLTSIHRVLIESNPEIAQKSIDWIKTLPKNMISKAVSVILFSLGYDNYLNRRFESIYEQLMDLDPNTLLKSNVGNVIALPKAALHDEYRRYFTVKSNKPKYPRDEPWDFDYVFLAIASNPEATRFPEFRELFDIQTHDGDLTCRIKVQLMMNPKAPQLPEFKNLLLSNFPVALNPGAVHFEGYNKLLDEHDPEVEWGIRCNPEARKLPEFAHLDPPECGCEDPNKSRIITYTKEELERKKKTIDWESRLKWIETNVPTIEREHMYKEVFEKLSPDLSEFDLETRERLLKYKPALPFAADPKSVNDPNFRDLFKNKNNQQKFELTSNPAAPQFEEFGQLFHCLTPWALADPNDNLLYGNFPAMNAVSNPNAITHPDFGKLFTNPPPTDNHNQLASYCTAVAMAAARQDAVKLPEYRYLFNFIRLLDSAILDLQSDEEIYQAMLKACNPPPKLSTDWATSEETMLKAKDQPLKLDPKWITCIRTAVFQARRKYGYNSILNVYYPRIAKSDLRKFHSYLIPILFEVAGNPEAAKLPEYKQLFQLTHPECRYIIQNILKNPEAQKLPEFTAFKSKIMTNPNIYLEKQEEYVEERLIRFDDPDGIWPPKYISDRHMFQISDEEGAQDFNVKDRKHEEWEQKQRERPYHRINFYEYISIGNVNKLYEETAVFSKKACLCKDYIQFFFNSDPQIRTKAAKNPAAVRFPEFKDLFNDLDIGVRIEALKTYYNHLNEQFRRFGIPPSAENIPQLEAAMTLKGEKLVKL
jgi:hypothetical protein